MILDGILTSATRIVLLLLTVTACVAFLTGKLEAKDFMLLVTGVFAFYFTVKSDPANAIGKGK